MGIATLSGASAPVADGCATGDLSSNLTVLPIGPAGAAATALMPSTAVSTGRRDRSATTAPGRLASP
jgi:hypothetical protein